MLSPPLVPSLEHSADFPPPPPPRCVRCAALTLGHAAADPRHPTLVRALTKLKKTKEKLADEQLKMKSDAIAKHSLVQQALSRLFFFFLFLFFFCLRLQDPALPSRVLALA